MNKLVTGTTYTFEELLGFGLSYPLGLYATITLDTELPKDFDRKECIEDIIDVQPEGVDLTCLDSMSDDSLYKIGVQFVYEQDEEEHLIYSKHLEMKAHLALDGWPESKWVYKGTVRGKETFHAESEEEIKTLVEGAFLQPDDPYSLWFKPKAKSAWKNPVSIKEYETEKLLEAINNINTYLQQKDNDVIISDYQLILLRLSFYALHELSSSTQGFHAMKSLQNIKQSYSELNSTNLNDASERLVNWIKPTEHDQRVTEINLDDCFDLIH